MTDFGVGRGLDIEGKMRVTIFLFYNSLDYRVNPIPTVRRGRPPGRKHQSQKLGVSSPRKITDYVFAGFFYSFEVFHLKLLSKFQCFPNHTASPPFLDHRNTL